MCSSVLSTIWDNNCSYNSYISRSYTQLHRHRSSKGIERKPPTGPNYFTFYYETQHTHLIDLCVQIHSDQQTFSSLHTSRFSRKLLFFNSEMLFVKYRRNLYSGELSHVIIRSFSWCVKSYSMSIIAYQSSLYLYRYSHFKSLSLMCFITPIKFTFRFYEVEVSYVSLR